jgi:hypothetical protein
LPWQANDVAIAFMARASGAGVAAPLPPTGWTLIWNLGSAAGTDRHSVLYGRRLQLGDDTSPSFDLPGASGDASMVLAIFRGVSTTEWEDVAEAVLVGENSTNPTNPELVTVTDGAAVLVMAHITHGGLTAMGAPGVFSPVNAHFLLHANSLMAWRVKDPAGTVIPGAWANVGGADTNDYTLVTYALRPLPAGGAQTVAVGLVAEADLALPAVIAFPGAPTGVAAVALSPTEVEISWNAVTGATGYDIQRRQALDAIPTWSAWTVIEASWDTTTFNDTELTQYTRYQYQVRTSFADEATEPIGVAVEFDAALPLAAPLHLRTASETDLALPIAFGGTAGAVIYNVGFEDGLEGIQFTADGGTIHDIINDPTARNQGSVLRLTGNSDTANRARVEQNLYQADPQNLPHDAIYEIDFYLAVNQQECNIFQFKQGVRHALAPHTGVGTYDAQTRCLLWFIRVQHVGNGAHNFHVRGKLHPNGQWWNAQGAALGTYQIAAAAGNPVQTGQWHHIECHYKWAGDNTGRIRVVLDGAVVCDVNQVTRLPLVQTGPEPDGVNWVVPGDTTWKVKPMQWTFNNYMTTGPNVPAATTNYFDNARIRLP